MLCLLNEDEDREAFTNQPLIISTGAFPGCKLLADRSASRSQSPL